MNKRVIVALALFVGLVGVDFATRTTPPSAVAGANAWGFEGTTAIDEVELILGSGERYVFSRAGSVDVDADPRIRAQSWTLTHPVTGRVNPRHFEMLETLFAGGLGTDRSIDADGLAEVGLTAGPESTQIVARANGEERLSMRIGTSEMIANSNARRLWIQPSGEDGAHRVYAKGEHVALDELLTKPLVEWRDRTVFKAETEIRSVSVNLQNTTPPSSYQIGRPVVNTDAPNPAAKNQGWVFLTPNAGALDVSKAMELVSGLSHLQARNFAEYVSAATTGLETPSVRIEIELDPKTKVLLIGHAIETPTGVEGPSGRSVAGFYAKFEDEPALFVLNPTTVKSIALTLETLQLAADTPPETADGTSDETQDGITGEAPDSPTANTPDGAAAKTPDGAADTDKTQAPSPESVPTPP